MSIGEKLKEGRRKAGLSQEQLAEKLCVSRQAITKWESNRGMPDIGNIQNIAKLFGVSIDYLLDDGETILNNVIKETDSLNNMSAYYLVELEQKQLLVNVTKEFIESRELSCKFTEKKIVIGNNLFKKTTYTI